MSSLQIPTKLRQHIHERDEGMCQYCGACMAHIHHIVGSGIGRRRIHRPENLISLCLSHHGLAHESREFRQWCIEWSRQKYGNAIDKIIQDNRGLSKWETLFERGK